MRALDGLRTLREERPAVAAVGLLVLGALLAWPLVDWWLRAAGLATPVRFFDWGAYEGAITRWRTGEPLYVRGDDGSYHGTYLYPPVFLLLFRVVADPLPFRAAAIVWQAGTIGLLWVGLQLVIRDYGLRLVWWERAVLLGAVVGFAPTLLAAKMGQVSAFIAAMLTLALYGLRRGQAGRPVAAPLSGVLTAIGATIKLPYAPVGAHLLQDRRRLAGAVVTGLILTAISVGVYGLAVHRAYLDVLLWGKGWVEPPLPPTAWQPPYFRPLYVLGTLALPVRLLGSLAVAGLAIATAGVDVDAETFALGVTAMPLLAPQADAYYLVALLPAVVVLLAGEFGRAGGRPIVPLVGLLLLHVHPYGLKLLVDHLPAAYGIAGTVEPLAPLLQPALWGCLLLSGLAAVRVGEAVELPVSRGSVAPGD